MIEYQVIKSIESSPYIGAALGVDKCSVFLHDMSDQVDSAKVFRDQLRGCQACLVRERLSAAWSQARPLIGAQ